MATDIGPGDADATQYETATRAWAELQRAGNQDPAKANRLVDVAQRAFLRLRTTPAGRAHIESLATDEDPYVRLWAATRMVAWNPAAARSILVSIRDANQPGLSASFDAKWTVIELDRGRLRVDWDPDKSPRE